MKRLFRHLHDAPDGLDIYDILDKLQMDIGTEIFLGISTDSLKHGKSPLRDAMGTILRINSMRLTFGYVMQLHIEPITSPNATHRIKWLTWD